MTNNTFQNELHHLGKTIKDLREIFRLSQTKLSKLAGVSRSVIADVEQGKHFPTVLTLLLLCDIFGITMAELCAATFPACEGNGFSHERYLLHKALHNSMDKNVTDAAISQLRRK